MLVLRGSTPGSGSTAAFDAQAVPAVLLLVLGAGEQVAALAGERAAVLAALAVLPLAPLAGSSASGASSTSLSRAAATAALSRASSASSDFRMWRMASGTKPDSVCCLGGQLGWARRALRLDSAIQCAPACEVPGCFLPAAGRAGVERAAGDSGGRRKRSVMALLEPTAASLQLPAYSCQPAVACINACKPHHWVCLLLAHKFG